MNMKFSVIIPTYNRGWVIKESIDSVLNQSISDFEIIVVDDGSTDETLEILKQYGNNISVVHKTNEGPAIARNFGANKAKGDYLVFLDDDDIFFPFTLEVYNMVITSKNFPPYVFGQNIFFNTRKEIPVVNELNKIEVVTYRDYFSKDRFMFTSCSMMVIRKEIFHKIEGFRSKYTKPILVHEDFHLLLKIGEFGPAVVILNPKLYGYRIHDDNSVKNISRVLKSQIVLINELKRDENLKYDKRKYGKFLIVGGTSYHWIKKAIKNGNFNDAAKLFLKSFPMLVISILNKAIQFFRSKTAIEEIEF